MKMWCLVWHASRIQVSEDCVAHYDSYTARVAARLTTARHKMLYGGLREQVSNTGIKNFGRKKTPHKAGF
jgi:hypothetical protein